MMSTLSPPIPGPAAAAAAVATGEESSLFKGKDGSTKKKKKRKTKASSSSSASDESTGEDGSSSSNKRSRQYSILKPETVQYLRSWMMSPAHFGHPYPTDLEKQKIMADTGLELKQLKNWFVNNRKRYWKPRVDKKKKQEEEEEAELQVSDDSTIDAVAVTPTRACLQSSFDSDPGESSAASAAAANKKTTTTKKKAPRKKKAASRKKKAASKKKKAASKKKKAASRKKKAASKKKKAVPNKKKAAPTDSVLPKNLSEVLENNVSTFPTGFAATISSELFSNLLFEVLVKYELCDQATEERPILHQRLGKGRDGSGCSYITIDWGHIKEVVRALGPNNAPGCQQFIEHFKRCFLDENRESGCTLSRGRGCQIRLYDGGATSSKHNDATRNMVNRYMSSLCVDPNEVRGLNLFANYYVDGVQKTTSDIVGEYTIPSGSSIMISALAAGNAQDRNQPPTTFSSTEYGDKTFLKHQSTPCKGRNMCLIIDFDECDQKVYKSFLEKNCNRTTFEKGLELRADVEQAVTEEFRRPRSKQVRNSVRERLSDVPSGFFSNKPPTKQHTRNHWKQFGLLRQPYQCDKCGHQYHDECSRMLQHKENCKHTTAVLMSSAQLLLVELPGNSPKTVKEDSESKKNEEDRTHERRLRFSNDCKKFNFLLQNHPYYRSEGRQGMNMLQKNKFRQQIDFEISEGRREKEELQQRTGNKNVCFLTRLEEGVFDNVDMDGNVSYTMGPYKYNLEWYDFQKKCDQDQSYKYPPFATNYKKNWKPRKEGYLIRQKKRDDELFKEYGTKIIRTAE